VFGLNRRKPPDQLEQDAYRWPMSEDERQERLASLRAHVQELRAERTFEPALEPLPATRPVRYEPEPEPEPEVLYPPSVPWRTGLPTMPGLYWWRFRGIPPPEAEGVAWPRLCVVVAFGGRLVVRSAGHDSSTWRSVSALAREWAGPVATPEDFDVEDLEL